jgi:hypothetical protein
MPGFGCLTKTMLSSSAADFTAPATYEGARSLDPMIAGPESGPSSDMQRYEG